MLIGSDAVVMVSGPLLRVIVRTVVLGGDVRGSDGTFAGASCAPVWLRMGRPFCERLIALVDRLLTLSAEWALYRWCVSMELFLCRESVYARQYSTPRYT